MQQEKKNGGYALWKGALVCAAVAAGLLMLLSILVLRGGLLIMASDMVALLLALMPLPAIFLGARHGAGMAAAFWAAAMLAAWPLMGAVGPILLALLIPAVGACVWAIRKKLRPFEALVTCCAGFTASLAVAAGAIFLVSHQDPLTFLNETIVGSVQASEQAALAFYPYLKILDVLSGGASMNVLFQPATTAQMLQFVREPAQLEIFRQIIAGSVPFSAVTFALYGGLLGFFLCRALVKATGGEVGRVPAFSRLMLPRTTGNYLLATYILGMLPALFSLTQLTVAGDVLRHFAQIVFGLQGLSLIDFLLRLRIRSTAGRVAILIALWLFIPTLVAWIGIFEHLLRLRERLRIEKRGP